MCGNDSLARISRWFRSLPKKTAESFGCSKWRPSIATLSNILRMIPVDSVEKALGACFSDKIPINHIAIDGKSLRGTSNDTVSIVHLLSAFLVENQKVINQIRMKTGENEITSAMILLMETNIDGGIITGDAIFAPKKYVKQ
jgi:hypothetical protein